MMVTTDEPDEAEQNTENFLEAACKARHAALGGHGPRGERLLKLLAPRRNEIMAALRRARVSLG